MRQSFHMPEWSLSAVQLVRRLTGVRTVALATTTAGGAPRVAPIGALLWRGRFAIPTVATAARTRHLLARPALSLTYFEGTDFAVIVHGRAVVVRPDAEAFATLDGLKQADGGQSVREWGAGVYLLIETETIYTYTSDPA